MRQTLALGLLATFMLASLVTAAELSQERQREIIENYLVVQGQRPVPSAAGAAQTGGEKLPPPKCGTPAILDFYRNYANLDRRMIETMGAQIASRPVLTYTYDSPGGHIRLHYDKTGDDAVWQSGVDSDGDGVPNFVESIALIADSAYSFMTDTLGFPAPENDSAETDGGDHRTDIYIVDLAAGYYGMTYPVYTQFTPSGRRTTPGWVELENDFQELESYASRPLDAVRVTMAHELFHLSHFVMDPTEDIVWFEMSSTWMEETQYDEINDYYAYLPFFLTYYLQTTPTYYYQSYPRVSLNNANGRHEYASVLLPIFLTENYDRNIVKSIWQNAGIDLGPTFLTAMDHAIDSASNHGESFHSAFARFAVWNFFTGTYADQAPNGIGYSERANYPYIPLAAMDLYREYPDTLVVDTNLYRLGPNATTYVRLENLSTVPTPPVWITIVRHGLPQLVRRALQWYAYGDSLPSGGWGVSAIVQLAAIPDSHLVVSSFDAGRLGMDIDALVGDTAVWECNDTTLQDSVVVCTDSTEALTVNPAKYRSITFVLTPTSIQQDYIYDSTLQYAYRRLSMGYFLGPYGNIVDSALLNVPSAVLAPYPNPAVVAEMGGKGLTFRFRLPTDSTTYPAYPTAYLLVDVFNIAGERVKTVEGVFVGDDRTGVHREGIYEAEWDMRNDGGKEVASGAYLAYARLYESSAKTTLLADDRVKVAVIR